MSPEPMSLSPEPCLIDWDGLGAVLRDSFFAHVAFVDDSGIPQCVPLIVPVLQLPEDAEPFLYLHGHPLSPLMRQVTDAANKGSNVIISVAATKVDGINLSSAPNGHSFNYRTVSINGSCFPGPTDIPTKKTVMKAVVNHIVPNRWEDLNPVSSEVLSVLRLVRVRVNKARVRVRQGGPNIQPRHPEVDGVDKPGGVWTGVIPVWEQLGFPVDTGKTPGTDMPAHLAEFVVGRNMAQKEYASKAAVQLSTAVRES